MTIRTRGGDGRARRTLKAAQRDMRAAELHGQGISYREIADLLGFASGGNAFDAVLRAFAALPTEGVEEARRLDLFRIDMLMQEGWQVIGQGDPALTLAAIGRITRLLHRRAMIFGYDATVEVDVVAMTASEAGLRRLEAELGLNFDG